MAGTYKLIGSVTVGAGGQAAIEFTSIPATYTDLVVSFSLRTTRSLEKDDPVVQFNSNGSNYSYKVLLGTGSAVSSYSGGTSFIYLGECNGDTSTSSTFSNQTMYIPNYASSNNKSVSIDSGQENNATAANSDMIAGLWANSSAITSLKIYSVGAHTIKQYSTAYLYGIEIPKNQITPKATGGDITYDSNYVYHTFRQSGTFTPTQSLTADYLVVAGGGGGGEEIAGGGGAGGLRSTVGATGGGGSLESALSLTAQAYTVTVGAGGAGGINSGSTAAINGSNSVFGSITSTGGGYGGSYLGTDTNGNSGGSGGGGSAAGAGGTSGGAASPSGQGYAGAGGTTSGSRGGGGGGGAGGVGSNGGGTAGTQYGGVGVQITALANATLTGADGGYYAGGGGGGNNSTTSGAVSAGGLGGGGIGGNYFGAPTGVAGTAGRQNTGGGGGAGGNNANGGAGGSGIVIVRYAI
jgi:hypothetical protein